MTQRAIVVSGIVIAGVAAVTAGAAGQGFPTKYMELRELFHHAEEEGISQTFVGVHTSDGVREGLYPLRSTGASTAPVREAADAFLEALTPTQLMRTQFAVNDLEWRRWLNVDNGIYSRRGTPLAEMSASQREAAMHLLAASLSVRGLEQSRAIMLTDQALKELNPEMAYIYGPDLYYFTIMGTPSEKQPWGWQLDGHHLVINYFVLGDQVVMTPTFWGGEPAVSRQGSTAGNSVLQDEQNLGLALMQSLSAEQQAIATLDRRKPLDNMVAGAQQDNLVLDYAGLPASRMTSSQRDRLVALIESYVGNMREPHAAVRMEEVLEHLNETRFAWVGTSEDDAVFYYRIHSPVILIEFDHQRPVGTPMINPPGVPTRDHIHTIVRTPNGNDYGKDLLAKHLAAEHGQ